MRIDRIMRAVSGSLWFITPEKAREILGVLELRAEGQEFQQPHSTQSESHKSDRPTVVSGVAVIPVYGTISPRMNLMSALSGGTSTEVMAKQIRSAVADPTVTSILLDIDSPGGNVNGVPELAEEIFSSRGSKPIVAAANFTAGSAAYYIASACDRIVASTSGEVGSIGCVAIHSECSKRNERDGVTYTVIRSPEGKADGNPYEPLSSAATANVQASIDEWHMRFASDVARYRGVDVKTVLDNYGAGRMLSANAALAAGMIDDVCTFEQELARLQARTRERTHVRASGNIRTANGDRIATAQVQGRCEVDLVELLSSIGLKAATTVEEAQAIVADLAARASAGDKATAALASAENAVAALTERVEASDAKVAELTTAVSERDALLRESEINAVLASAKLKPKAEAFARDLAASDMDKFKAFVAMQGELSVEKPSGKLQVTPVDDPADERMALHARIVSYQKAHNVSYAEAFQALSKGKE